MSYYIEGPNGKVYPCNWVQYEQAKAFGYYVVSPIVIKELGL